MVNHEIEYGDGHYSYDCFDIEGSEEYSGIVGFNMIQVTVYCVVDNNNDKLPCGLCLEFSSSKKIWSTMGNEYHWIGTKYPQWMDKFYNGLGCKIRSIEMR